MISSWEWWLVLPAASIKMPLWMMGGHDCCRLLVHPLTEGKDSQNCEYAVYSVLSSSNSFRELLRIFLVKIPGDVRWRIPIPIHQDWQFYDILLEVREPALLVEMSKTSRLLGGFLFFRLWIWWNHVITAEVIIVRFSQYIFWLGLMWASYPVQNHLQYWKNTN